MMQRRLILAHLFASKGKISSAIDVYEKIFAEACSHLEISDHQEDHSDSTTTLEATAKVYYNLSQSVIQTVRVLEHGLSESDRVLLLDKCTHFLLAAISQNPALIESYLNLSGLYIKLQRPAQAIPVIREALQSSSPYFKELLVNLNVAYRQLNQRLLAIQDTWSYLSIPCQPSPPYIQLLVSFLCGVASYEESRRCNQDEVLTIVCVKYGQKYGPEYVIRLFNMIEKTWSVFSNGNAGWREFRFVCLTDDPVGLQVVQQRGGKVLPLAIAHLEHIVKAGGWWSKVSIFNTSAYVSAASCSSILYVDLDTVISKYSLRNLHQVFASLPLTTPHSPQCYMYYLDAACLLAEGRYRGVNSSLLLFPPVLFDCIYTFYAHWGVELLRGVHKFDHFLEMMFGEMLYDPVLTSTPSAPDIIKSTP
ncbi:hypothetical protein EON65_34825, partial [archaeon]